MPTPSGPTAFTQTRHLVGVRAPLVSQGVVTISANQVQWHVTQPVDIVTIIGPTGMTQSVEGGPAQPLAAGSGDAFLSSSGLRAVLNGDFSSARTQYDITRLPAGADGAWNIRLRPRAGALARFIAAIDVRGCAEVARVSVRQVSGDWMDIDIVGHELR